MYFYYLKSHLGCLGLLEIVVEVGLRILPAGQRFLGSDESWVCRGCIQLERFGGPLPTRYLLVLLSPPSNGLVRWLLLWFLLTSVICVVLVVLLLLLLTILLPSSSAHLWNITGLDIINSHVNILKYFDAKCDKRPNSRKMHHAS